jgi:ornithine cyclodeaminase
MSHGASAAPADAIAPRVIPAHDIERFGYARAVAAVEAALRGGLDPAADPPRVSTALGGDASLLYMPSLTGHGAGAKLVTLNPGNSAAGLPTVNGVYVLFDRGTLVPAAILDGAALTTLRTPAVSMAAVRPALRRFGTPVSVVVFGAGPQGTGHAAALCDLAAHDAGIPAPAAITYVTRRGLGGQLPGHAGVQASVVPLGSTQMTGALRVADIVVCATGARAPLFDSSLLSEQTVTIAIGTHDPGASEIDMTLFARAHVIVEDVAAALRECGEVVQATRAGVVAPGDLLTISEVASGKADQELAAGPVVFKGSGMAWEDLVVAQAIAGAPRDPAGPASTGG